MRRLLIAVTAVVAVACSSSSATAPKLKFNITGDWSQSGPCGNVIAAITQSNDSLMVIYSVNLTCGGQSFGGDSAGMILGDSVWFGDSPGTTFNGHVVNDSTMVGADVSAAGSFAVTYRKFTPE